MNIEEISAEIHKCYCRAYEKRFGKPYWTNGDYSKLDEPTKDYDREMARWHISEVKRIVEPLVKCNDIKRDKLVEVLADYAGAINETLNRAKISEGL